MSYWLLLFKRNFNLFCLNLDSGIAHEDIDSGSAHDYADDNAEGMLLFLNKR